MRDIFVLAFKREIFIKEFRQASTFYRSIRVTGRQMFNNVILKSNNFDLEILKWKHILSTNISDNELFFQKFKIFVQCEKQSIFL